MHRWVWDLHYPAPDATRHDYPISAIPGDTPRYPLGPTALPGTYTARLTANGKSTTAPFAVKMDPRVNISAASLQKQFEMETRLAKILSATSKAVQQAGSIRDQLQKLNQQASGSAHDSAVLGAPAGFNAPPSTEMTLTRANAQVAALYSEVGRADAEPTAAQYEAATAAERDASDLVKRWEALQTSDLPALNHALDKAKLPRLQLESEIHGKETGMDEE
jgi:hypothetical protein